MFLKFCLILFFVFLQRDRVVSQLSCKNPLYLLSYNSWAVFPNSTLQTPSTFNSLKICSYLNNEASCCNPGILDTYQIEWDLFKDYFNEENKQQLLKMSSKVENAYSERNNTISIYENANLSLRSIYSISDSLRSNQNLSSQLDNLSSYSYGNLGNLGDYGVNSENLKKLANNTFGINLSDFETVNLNDYLDYNKRISDYLLRNSGLSQNQQDYFRYLDGLDENGLNLEINNTKTRYEDLIRERSKCFSGLFRHFASLMCLSCESDYLSKGISILNKKVHLNLSTDTCTKMQGDCFGYLDKLVEMNKNAIFFANTQSIDSLNLTNANQASYSSASDLITFISDRITSIQDFLSKQILFSMPRNCTQGDCSWICYNYITSTGLNYEQILNGTMISTDSLNLNLNLGTPSGRILQNLTLNDHLTVNFNDSFPCNTYIKADTTNLNFTIDGGAGIILFQNGNASNVFNTNSGRRKFFNIIFGLVSILFLII